VIVVNNINIKKEDLIIVIIVGYFVSIVLNLVLNQIWVNLDVLIKNNTTYVKNVRYGNKRIQI
jgi:hypothetical protein